MVAAEDEFQRIGEEFGDRDFLLPEIVAYLRTIGRYIDPGLCRHSAGTPSGEGFYDRMRVLAQRAANVGEAPRPYHKVGFGSVWRHSQGRLRRQSGGGFTHRT